MYEGNVVIFAEKPAMAYELSKPFGHKKINDFTYEILPNKLFPQGAKVIWGVSQLYVPLLTYWKNGLVTKEFKLVKKDVIPVEKLNKQYGTLLTEKTKEHLDLIKKELNESTIIIDATDHEEVGDAIFELFYKFSSTKTNKIFKFKCYSLLEEDIILGYKRAEEINVINETEEYMQNIISFLKK